MINASKVHTANGRFSWTFMRCARLIGVNIVIFCFFFIFIEGLASYLLVVRNFISAPATKSLAKQQYTKYDADLGWINKPNVFIADVYGPGVYFRTNAQGFRNNHDIAKAVSEGKTRIICSGDSYTHGYGVDNVHSWCELLSTLDPRLETVNMGEDAYGTDQAYLRYKRDAANIQHQVQLFAFITDDLYRMLNDSFLGYAKPILEIENGNLVVKNVPVPTRDYYFPWVTQIAEKLKGLRTVEFSNRVLWKIGVFNSRKLTQTERDEKARQLLQKMFAELKRINRERSSQLVLVYLPTIWELEGRGFPSWTAPEEWTKFFEEQSRVLDVPLVNVFSKFRSLPHNEMVNMFIPAEKLPYPEAQFHLNEKGNEVVARVVYDKLMKDPTISCNLSIRSPSEHKRLFVCPRD